MTGKLSLLLVTQFFSIFLFSQELSYARKIIDTLAGDYFIGRGAVDDGEKKASFFIAKEFKFIGLNKFSNTYFQEYNYPINTFPGELAVSLDNTKLIAGKDFLVDPSSGQTSGTFKLVWYNKGNVPSKKQLKKLASRNFFDDKFIIIDEDAIDNENESMPLLKMNVLGAGGIIFIENIKLTMHLSTSYNDFGILHIKRESINRDFKTISLTINQKFIRNYESQNVIGFVEGSLYPDSFIVLSAHYDHLGKMGNEVYFPGANDNASGIAMLLNLADHYTNNERPKKSIIFIAFGGEEAGLIGSRHFVNNPLIPLNKINFVFNMDLMGTGSEGAMIVNGTVYKNHYSSLEKINDIKSYLPIIKKRGKAANSDHYWFSEKGVPSFFIYLMGGIKAYHDIHDISTTLPLTKFEDSFRLIRDFVDEL